MGNAHKCIDGKSDGILSIRWLQASESAALYLNEITNEGVFVLLLPYSEAKTLGAAMLTPQRTF